jgi:hypothetical protein
MCCKSAMKMKLHVETHAAACTSKVRSAVLPFMFVHSLGTLVVYLNSNFVSPESIKTNTISQQTQTCSLSLSLSLSLSPASALSRNIRKIFPQLFEVSKSVVTFESCLLQMVCKEHCSNTCTN